MTELELMRVRMLITEASLSGANRMRDFMSEYADLWQDISGFYQTLAPDGAELPPELHDKIEAFRAKHHG